MGAVLLSAGYLAGVAAPDRLARGGDPEGFQRGNVDLGERRERLDGVAHHLERHARPDRQSRLLQPLAGLRAERIGPGQPFALLSRVMNPFDLSYARV